MDCSWQVQGWRWWSVPEGTCCSDVWNTDHTLQQCTFWKDYFHCSKEQNRPESHSWGWHPWSPTASNNSARTTIWHQSPTFNSRTQKAALKKLWSWITDSYFVLYENMAMICTVGDLLLWLGHSVPLISTIEHSLGQWGTPGFCLVVRIIDTSA